ncbi:MAG: cell division protein FtsQ/DivIB [Acidimicrobiales bacterium]
MSPTRTDAPARPQGRPATDRPSLDPRIRQRRAAVTRRRGRRRLVVVVCLAALAAAAVGGWFLLHSRWLSARVVTVVGSVHTPPAEIEAVAGLAGHPPMVDVDPGAAAARLEQLPWVRSATVQRQWPDGVRVTVVEETPVAVVAPPAGDPRAHAGTPGAWALVDRAGRVLADRPGPPAGLVRLEPPSRPGAPGSWLAPAAGPGLVVAATLPRAFSAQVTAVVVNRGGQVTLDMTTPVTVKLGDTTQLDQKYEAAAAALAGAKLAAGDVINVSVPDSTTVGPG